MKTIIIDDVQANRQRLRKTLDQYAPELDIVGEAEGVQSGYECIALHKPELVLLDIEMEDGTGFDLLHLTKAFDFRVIFITAHDNYALKAFRFSAIDYILKPIDLEDLLFAIDKAKNQIGNNILQRDTLLQNNKAQQKIILTDADTLYLVEIEEIVRCQSQNNYTRFHLTQDREILITKTLKEYEDLFEGCHFFRCHRSHLINLKHFDKLDKRDGGTIYMKDGSNVPMANQKKEQLWKALQNLPLL